MQSLHTMSHRSAGATRTNARWHPYTPPRSSAVAGPSVACTPNSAAIINSSVTSSTDAYLITPVSMYNISPAASLASRSPRPSVAPRLPSLGQQTRLHPTQKPSTAKASYVASLVDQAVRSLSEVWKPEYIPSVFATSTQITLSKPSTASSLSACQSTHIRRNSGSLPSPCSPLTQHSPLPSLPPSASAFLGEHFATATIVAEKDLVPIRAFVHEVLRRSRTTCSVLQSALCYVEAVRCQVPELVEREKSGLGIRGELRLDERIVTEEDRKSKSLEDHHQCEIVEGFSATELIEVASADSITNLSATALENASIDTVNASSVHNVEKCRLKPTAPLPALPSPLLCPRRTFLAALILASKFLQDRCYSNRAWAKLSGLPPREVGRCERALGDALGWRLWVGKGALSREDGSRSLARTRSEGCLSSSSTMRSGIPSPPLSDSAYSPEICRSGPSMLQNKPLTRAKTMPDDIARHISQQQHGLALLPFPFPTTREAVILDGDAGVSAFYQQNAIHSTSVLDFPTSSMFCSPRPLVDTVENTPNVMSSGNLSPPSSSSSSDSFDSTLSIGSIATPVDVTNALGSMDPRLALVLQANMLGTVERERIERDSALCWTQSYSSSKRISGFPGLVGEFVSFTNDCTLSI